MTWLEGLILGLVQGLTEFLPVSSSGHLVIFENLLDAQIDDSTAFFVLLHFATLISVCIMYRKDVWGLIKEFFLWIADIFRGRFKVKTDSRRLFLAVLISTVPAGVLGVIYKIFDLDARLMNLYVVGIMLLVTAFLMYAVDKFNKNTTDEKNIKPLSALFVGLAQAAALLPGLSRSGSTITAARAQGYKKEFAVKYSFLLSLPTILGAVILEGASLLSDGTLFNMDAGAAIAGFLAAAVSGILAIKFLITLLNKNRFYIFSIYCAAAGILCLVFAFIK